VAKIIQNICVVAANWLGAYVLAIR